MNEFEETEFRGPLFNQLENGSHLLWEPGQIFEKTIGIDRASFCLDSYLWELHGHNTCLGGCVLRGRPFHYIWTTARPSKLLPDFKLNLFIQAKRSTYSSQSSEGLKPNINGPYWHFEITHHQQVVLEQLENDLAGDGLVIYAAPVFHKQQDLYNHTSNRTIVANSTFPKASSLKGHTKWYFDKPGIVGVANPDFDFINQQGLLSQLQSKRDEQGPFIGDSRIQNLKKLSTVVSVVAEKNSDDFRASQFVYYVDLIDEYIERFQVSESAGLVDFLRIETFMYLWKLNWLTF